VPQASIEAMSERERWRAEAEVSLRASGRRVTSQRMLVLEALQALPGHQTVEAIHAWVNEREPTIALSTIYRTLEALSSVGLVATFDDRAGSTRYEWIPDDEHHHLVCTECGRRTEVELDAVADVEQEVERRYGFVAEIRHLAIVGACVACQPTGRQAGGAARSG
jgi:Fe2+ or Zn2+ uptake regulation protein